MLAHDPTPHTGIIRASTPAFPAGIQTIQQTTPETGRTRLNDEDEAGPYAGVSEAHAHRNPDPRQAHRDHQPSRPGRANYPHPIAAPDVLVEVMCDPSDMIDARPTPPTVCPARRWSPGSGLPTGSLSPGSGFADADARERAPQSR
jgi:hypothetical protein